MLSVNLSTSISGGVTGAVSSPRGALTKPSRPQGAFGRLGALGGAWGGSPSLRFHQDETGTLAALSRLWAPGGVERVTVGAPGVSDVSMSQPARFTAHV